MGIQRGRKNNAIQCALLIPVKVEHTLGTIAIASIILIPFPLLDGFPPNPPYKRFSLSYEV